jgi:hypothetical protein
MARHWRCSLLEQPDVVLVRIQSRLALILTGHESWPTVAPNIGPRQVSIPPHPSLFPDGHDEPDLTWCSPRGSRPSDSCSSILNVVITSIVVPSVPHIRRAGHGTDIHRHAHAGHGRLLHRVLGRGALAFARERASSPRIAGFCFAPDDLSGRLLIFMLDKGLLGT